MNITMTGNLGSGKTSVCKELKQLGYDVISAGDIFRDIAAARGISVIELNELAKRDRSIDDMLDRRSTELGQTLDHTVFDSRLAWHFVKKSFKVFLLVKTKEEYRSIEEVEEGLKLRADLEQERFLNLYGLDYYDGSNYDLIIESTDASPKQIAAEIERSYRQYAAEPFSTRVILNGADKDHIFKEAVTDPGDLAEYHLNFSKIFA